MLAAHRHFRLDPLGGAAGVSTDAGGRTGKYEVSHHFDSTMQHPGFLTQS